MILYVARNELMRVRQVNEPIFKYVIQQYNNNKWINVRKFSHEGDAIDYVKQNEPKPTIIYTKRYYRIVKEHRKYNKYTVETLENKEWKIVYSFDGFEPALHYLDSIIKTLDNDNVIHTNGNIRVREVTEENGKEYIIEELVNDKWYDLAYDTNKEDAINYANIEPQFAIIRNTTLNPNDIETYCNAHNFKQAKNKSIDQDTLHNNKEKMKTLLMSIMDDYPNDMFKLAEIKITKSPQRKWKVSYCKNDKINLTFENYQEVIQFLEKGNKLNNISIISVDEEVTTKELK